MANSKEDVKASGRSDPRAESLPSVPIAPHSASFLVPELDDRDDSGNQTHDVPPTYGEHLDHMAFSQPGFEADAAINGQ